MFWYGAYVAVAALVAMAIFLAACWFREEHVAAPDFPGVISAVAGILWPVLLVGLSEMTLVWWVFRRAGYTRPDALPFT